MSIEQEIYREIEVLTEASVASKHDGPLLCAVERAIAEFTLGAMGLPDDTYNGPSAPSLALADALIEIACKHG